MTATNTLILGLGLGFMLGAIASLFICMSVVNSKFDAYEKAVERLVKESRKL